MSLLDQALVLDAHNPFTLNNRGVAFEAIGGYGSALKSYNAAAALNSSEPVVVALDRTW